MAPAIERGKDDPRFLPHTTSFEGKRIYHPLLEKVFAIAKKWTPPSRKERQPITLLILRSLCDAVPSRPGAELGLAATVRDAAILGMFTGSRVSEYAQTSAASQQPFTVVPCNSASGAQGGQPLAFTFSDFSFFSGTHLQLAPENSKAAAYVRVRFRYTKGVRSFEHRIFAALPGPPFCPVAAAARVVKRWGILQQKVHTPLFCFMRSFLEKQPTYLTDSHMNLALRQAAVKTYPDSSHLVRQHLQEISSHSLRVFACLCLKQTGWDEDTISHQLRWNSSAVKYYIRQSVSQADKLSASLFEQVIRKQF